ncbi:MAG TPA: SDR family NAD(P)-dependent oxidoreductase [Dehalococcoidia bacterium]
MKLRDRNVWLIGASSGIGAELVPRLAAEGARLTISARGKAELQRLADAEAVAGRSVTVRQVDVTEAGALERVAGEIAAAGGPVDVLIYGAGQWQPVEVDEWDAASIENQITVNYVGFVRALGAVLPQMVARHSGDIVGIASVGGYAGFPRAEAYGSAKAAMIALLQSLRMDLRKHGVGVVTINPGFVDTPLTRKNDFPMPFLMSSPTAADRIMKGLLSGEREIHFPKRLTWTLKLVTALPDPVYERVASRFMARG